MSTLVHSPSSPVADARPALRLLERPVRRGQVPSEAPPSPSWSDWLARQVERYWAWGESLNHHRLGSWLRH